MVWGGPYAGGGLFRGDVLAKDVKMQELRLFCRSFGHACAVLSF